MGTSRQSTSGTEHAGQNHSSSCFFFPRQHDVLMRPKARPRTHLPSPRPPPLDFDYNNGVSSDPVDFDDNDNYYGTTSVNHGDDDADDDTLTHPLRADETGVTVGWLPS